MVDYQKYGGIRAKDRPFSSSGYLPGEGLDQTSSSSFPGNVVTPAGLGSPSGDPSSGYANPACLPPLSFPTTGSPRQCRFDNASLIDIVNPSERLNVVGALTWQLNRDNQFFLQSIYAANRFTFTASPAGISNMTLPVTSAFYPHAFAQSFGIDGTPLSIRWRAYELGLRTDATTSDQWNVVAGMQGAIRGWNYDGALAYGENSVNDRYVDGYARGSVLFPILNSGVVNPFGFNTPEVVALMSTAKLDQTVRTGKGTLASVDFHASNDIYPMPAGPLAVAVGAEARQWKLNEASSAALASGDIVGRGLFPVANSTSSRNVWAVFTEANVPIVRTVEGNLAVRFDHYSDFGSTTNPKLSLRWQPTKTFLARASYGTGFRAPALPELFSPLVTTNTQPGLSDPVRCPVTNDQVNDCVTQFVNIQGGNTALKPEESTQYSVGAVWEPLDGLSLGVDWYSIKLKDQVGLLNPAAVLGDVVQYAAFNTRGPTDPNFPTLPGPITAITTLFTNLGETRIEGIDVDLRYRTPQTAAGRFRFGLQGTYYTKYDIQQIDGSFAGQIGLYSGIGGAINRWKHYASIDWEYGAWGATLAQTFGLGYTDANPDVNGNPRRVGNYDVYDLQVRFTGVKNLTVSAGIKNLFNRAPPFTNQSFTFQNGYDPSYADPRGGFWYANIGYKFL
jgi:iron complex outermembrane receptor protein